MYSNIFPPLPFDRIYTHVDVYMYIPPPDDHFGKSVTSQPRVSNGPAGGSVSLRPQPKKREPMMKRADCDPMRQRVPGMERKEEEKKIRMSMRHAMTICDRIVHHHRDVMLLRWLSCTKTIHSSHELARHDNRPSAETINFHQAGCVTPSIRLQQIFCLVIILWFVILPFYFLLFF